EVSGIRDILTKSLGSGNVFNRAKACYRALTLLRNPADVAEARGITVREMLGRDIEDPYADHQPVVAIATAPARAAVLVDEDSSDDDE
ncbi:MAG: hypothetical protein WCP21_20235, partial [Armatimonadota bacterium]